MYLSDLIREIVNDKVRETFIGKKVRFVDLDKGKVSITCKDASFLDDDGNCLVRLIDTENNEYFAVGQGIDIWYKIEE